MTDRRSFIKGVAITVGGFAIMGQSGEPGCETTTTTTTTTTEPPTTTTTVAPTTTTTAAPTTTTTTAPPGGDQTFSGDVSMPAGFTVPAGQIWTFNPLTSTTVRVRANVIVQGTLVMKPANEGVVHQLIFEGVNEAAFVGGGMSPVASDVGLWIVGQGQLDAVGSEKNAWTRAIGAIAVGATQFAVQDASGWRVGDTVVLTPTSPTSTSSYWNRYDQRTITSVSGNNVVVNSGVTNAHPAPVDQLGQSHPCEVLNLTRNVRVMGTTSGRSHIAWMMAQRPVHISNVEVAHMSVPNKVGRYALHQHMMGDASQGSVLRSVVAHDCGNHVFVPHASHGITLSRCVSHNSLSDAYWWDPEDDGSLVNATDTCLWTECVASKVDGGYRVGGFHLGVDMERGRPLNTIRNCVAVGVNGNGSPDTGAGSNSNDPAGYLWPELDERGGSVWIFENNAAHNCKHNGMFTWQNGGPVHFVDNSTVYNCNTAINHGAYSNSYRYRRGTIFACHRAVWIHAASGGSATNGQTYEDLDCLVTGPHAVNLNSVTGSGVSEARTLPFRRCKFRGHTGAGVRSWGEGGTPADDEWPGKWDFHDIDWDPTKPHVLLTSGAPVGTRVRELVNGVVTATHSK